MQELKRKDNETFDSMFHRFQQVCLKDGIFAEIRKREYFMPPSIKRKKKRAKAKKGKRF
ncbi:MAG: 30S ribosomal protein S21 [Caldisericales bacterium]|nr:30S ribosomal protein S21 [Caldisericales bacterium]